MTPQEMIIWLRGNWRLWAHGPLPPDMTLSHVLGDLADFIEKHRWRKLCDEKPPEVYATYLTLRVLDGATLYPTVEHFYYQGPRRGWDFYPDNVELWMPILDWSEFNE